VTPPEPERAGHDLEVGGRLEKASEEEAEAMRSRQVAAIARLVRRATVERRKNPVNGADRHLGATAAMRQNRGVMRRSEAEGEAR
jgi:hypothetical protein